jgi:hypothetical protein
MLPLIRFMTMHAVLDAYPNALPCKMGCTQSWQRGETNRSIRFRINTDHFVSFY